MNIAGRPVGRDHPVYVIAEIGVNHDGSLAKALALIELAAKAGADAVKFQYFEAQRLMSNASRLAAYQKEGGETDPVAMLDRLALSSDQLGRCVECAHENGVHAIVSVFSVELVERASTLGWDAYKSASPDVIHRPLLEAMAQTGTPLIVSTGASEAAEVERAREWLDPYADRVAFLQCVSSYPAPITDAHVGAVRTLGALVDPCPVGYSDHTALDATGLAAVRHGATLLEKHFTDDRTAPGPDHGASLEPAQFERYCWWARLTGREAHDAYFDDRLVGDSAKRVHACERDVRAVSRQSIVSTRALGVGETITRADLTFKRPGTGLEPWRLDEVLGTTLARDVEPDVPLTREDLS